MQHITTTLPAKFQKAVGHSLRPYGYMNDLGKIVGHLISGVRVGQHFSRGVPLDEETFYAVIWPLFAECVWMGIDGKKPLQKCDIEEAYRTKKAMRIISSPDLEPIKYLFLEQLSAMEKGPKLKGCFNQLSRLRGWSNVALTTDCTGYHAPSKSIIQTQTVVGRKHIADKTRELAGRLRSFQLDCAGNGEFVPSQDSHLHFLVVDGDWPVESKINLYEAGFDGIFEIGELSLLAETLESLSKQ
jgi:hypothetical protein